MHSDQIGGTCADDETMGFPGVQRAINRQVGLKRYLRGLVREDGRDSHRDNHTEDSWHPSSIGRFGFS